MQVSTPLIGKEKSCELYSEIRMHASELSAHLKISFVEVCENMKRECDDYDLIILGVRVIVSSHWFLAKLQTSAISGALLLGFLKCQCDFNVKIHCVKIVQRSFFWSVFSQILTKYRDLQSKYLDSNRIRENTDQKKLRIWTLFTQW